ncbi:type II toxin-antitoxin system RelE/ParE family toxin [Agrobacterium tumefaciens]|uniref:Toxin n=1 Tax=Agrobacterium tumefaciens TaxID=358 RepID=A0A2L2LB82_AGRTU|nr:MULTISPECIES: type II toxin-antitoxin system RelE/ParE family toxin [Agrobacterium]AVH41602.1 plasmid stabilization protein ParE [Agrobacterium tumefaciens]NSY95534.1 type II toxin-antitoxin system RelE/ParE family toxin [Agrobacterium tumefaciens]NSZ01231.1 type II toxin-antitoxin system RelE/ParE family toxin [Agrobacterium tumefaciens]NSZ37173.1 type II toxin-antitoxin system RelE/ParE family toxin [Agrobacterium tumefaciens]NTB02114.1 type II toxin-antitoxin system RelE/ParE family toxi
MSSYRLTKQAESEILDIFIYGVEQFGLRQAHFYKNELEGCFQLLGDNPRMGRLAPAIGEGVRRHEHGSHVIFYEIDGSGVLILTVVHGRSIRRLKL